MTQAAPLHKESEAVTQAAPQHKESESSDTGSSTTQRSLKTTGTGQPETLKGCTHRRCKYVPLEEAWFASPWQPQPFEVASARALAASSSRRELQGPLAVASNLMAFTRDCVACSRQQMHTQTSTCTNPHTVQLLTDN